MSERLAMEDQRRERERELLQQGAQNNNSNSKRSQDGEGDAEKSSKKGKGVACNSGSSNNSRPKCQVENCGADLTGVKEYYRRHRVCEQHSKARIAMVQGVQQRFCQQCSRFHVLEEFDEAKRSCRRRLQGHNERRRKTPCDALVIRPEPSHRVNGGWLKQREETDRLPLMLEAGATTKVMNKIKNH